MFRKLLVVGGLLLTLGMVGCAGATGTAHTTVATGPITSSTATTAAPGTMTTPTAGDLEPIVVPT